MVQLAGDSLKGRRETNEDRFIVDPKQGLCIVADGAGGRAGGQRAASIACECIGETLAATAALGTSAIDRAIERAHEEIRAGQNEPSLHGMATTVAIAAWVSDGVHIAHVGDTRAYLKRGDKLIQLTRDHSLENLVQDNPNLAGKHRAPGTTLVRSLGLNSNPPAVAHRTVDSQPGDIFLVCSDGVYTALPEWAMSIHLDGVRSQGANAVVKALVRSAVASGSMDNATAAILAIEADRPHRVALGWLVGQSAGRRGEIVRLGDRTQIGGAPDGDIVLNDDLASVQHAVVNATADGFVVRDESSNNETFINDKRIDAAPLVDGDRLRFGKTTFIFKSFVVP